MDFDVFLSKINEIKNRELGGLEAQFKLAPALRLRYDADKIAAKHPKKAAVLALFYPNEKNETCFLLTKRATYKGTHSSQISFPGGKLDPKDAHLQNTALRETFEEVGVSSEKIKIIRKITEVYIPPSNFLATPFIGYTIEKPLFLKNYEVAKTLEIPLKMLLDDACISSVTLSTSYAKNIKVPCFQFYNSIVWGATAMMLSEIRELLK